MSIRQERQNSLEWDGLLLGSITRSDWLGGQRMGYVLSIAMFAVVYGIFAWLIKLFDKA